MLFLIIVLFACVPLFFVFVYTTAAGIALSSSFVVTFQSTLARIILSIVIFAAVASTAVSGTAFFLPRLPDFQTVGDGGVGLAYNLACKIALVLLSPAATSVIVGLALHMISRARSQAERT